MVRLTRVTSFTMLGVLLALAMAACGSSSASPTPTPTPTATPPPVHYGVIRGIAAPCSGMARGSIAPVHVKVYRGNHKTGSPVVNVAVGFRQRDRYWIRVQPGTYFVVVTRNPSPGRTVVVRVGKLVTADFPNHCF